MSPDSQPHHSKGHPHHVGSSSHFGKQVQFQSIPNQPPEIFSFIEYYYNMSAKFPYNKCHQLTPIFHHREIFFL